MARFPKDLSSLVAERWDHLVAGDYIRPPCPPSGILKNILETCYLAASAPEESRYPQFNVVVTAESSATSPPGIVLYAFESSRALDVDELRRLAPATDMKKSAIWIVWNDERSWIAGLCDLGTSWHRAKAGLGYSYQAPNVLFIQLDRPGRIKVYQGPYAVASLTDGQLTEAQIEMHAFLHPIANNGLNRLESEFVYPSLEHPREYHNFWFIAHWNIFASIANSISASAHGGLLVITDDWDTSYNSYLRTKYACPSGELRSRFIDFINCRNKTADFWEAAAGDEKAVDVGVHEAELQLINASESLVEATRFVSQLAGCDGAIVMTADLKVLGFGVEIRAEMDATCTVSQVTSEFGEKYQPCDVEQFGMRHRSAIKLVSRIPAACVLAVSQDGPISAVWRKNDEVLVKKNISLVNMNMPWA